MAAKGEALRLCRCGNPINVQELREQSRDKAEAIHLTKTPAGMSQWLKGNYGYEVSRKRIVFCQVGVGRFGVSFSPCERRVSGRFGVGRSCWLLVIALVIA